MRFCSFPIPPRNSTQMLGGRLLAVAETQIVKYLNFYCFEQKPENLCLTILSVRSNKFKKRAAILC